MVFGLAAVHAGWSAVWEAAFAFNIAYASGLAPIRRVFLLWEGIQFMLDRGVGGVVACGAFLCWREPLVKYATVWLALEMLASVGNSGMAFPHYYILWITPMVAILAATYNIFTFPRAQLVLGSFIVVLILLYAQRDISEARKLYRSQVVDYLKEGLAQDQPYYAWGSVPRDFWFNVNRPSASAVFHTTPFHAPALYHSLATRILGDLEKKPPAIIVERIKLETCPLFAPFHREMMDAGAGKCPWETPALLSAKQRLNSKYRLVGIFDKIALFRAL